MSGTKEERPTAAAEPVEPAAEAEMTAAEALARATEAAAETDETAAPEPAGGDAPEPSEEAAPEPAEKAAPEPPEATPTPTGTAEGAPREPAAEAGPGEPGEGEPEPAAMATQEAEAAPAAEAPEPAEKAKAEPTESPEPAAERKPAPDAPAAPLPPERPELRVLREAMENRQPVEGRVIGWNNGGFHLAVGELSAFCPRSEMEIGEIQAPESYLDQTYHFRVLRLQGKGRRIVVSRAAQLRGDKSRQRSKLRKKLQPGIELDGTVASLTDFGAFVDLVGAQGLVHVSEISHRRVEHPGDVLSEGQEVRVKVLKVEQGGRRISLSIRSLEPDPWKDLAKRFPRGAVVKGKVERANQIGAFIELAPGVTGLLPARAMSIPRETTPARAYPPGKEVSVQIVSVDARRQRISLALEGSGLEGSRSDYQEYQRRSREAGGGEGFNALASAFRRLRDD